MKKAGENENHPLAKQKKSYHQPTLEEIGDVKNLTKGAGTKVTTDVSFPGNQS